MLKFRLIISVDVTVQARQWPNQESDDTGAPRQRRPHRLLQLAWLTRARISPNHSPCKWHWRSQPILSLALETRRRVDRRRILREIRIITIQLLWIQLQSDVFPGSISQQNDVTASFIRHLVRIDSTRIVCLQSLFPDRINLIRL